MPPKKTLGKENAPGHQGQGDDTDTDTTVHVKVGKVNNGGGDVDDDKVLDSASNCVVPVVRSGRACATAKDEPVVYFQLHGRNEVPFVKMWGWTNNCPMGFPNLKENLCMKKVIYNDGSVDSYPKALEEQVEYSQSIGQLGRAAASHDYVSINIPLVVQIVAKKKPDVIYKKADAYGKFKDKNNAITEEVPSTALLFGAMVVADATGACILTLPNESIHIIYDKVEVGDFLIIGKATYHKIHDTRKKFIYPFEEHLVGVEIKVEKYSVRQVSHIPFKSQPHFKPRFPEFLFGIGNEDEGEEQLTRLWTPKDFGPTGKIPQQLIATKAYVDIIGIVNYVGRVERFESFRNQVKHVECGSEADLTDGQNSKSGEQRIFKAYRWVSLIDKEVEKPLLLSLIISKSSVNLQRNIVPGMSMVITNCRIGQDEDNRSQITVAPSVCSQIYLNEDVLNYFALMPRRYVEAAANQILILKSYYSILQRNFDWGAGGSFSIGFPNPDSFYTKYKEWRWRYNHPDSSGAGHGVSPFRTKIPDNYIFGRRERLVLTIRGKIVLVQKVLEANSLHLPISKDGKWKTTPNLYVYSNSQAFEEMKKSAAQSFSHPSPCLCDKCSSKKWFHYARKVNLNIPNNVTTTRELCRAVTEDMKELCGPLLMPAMYRAGPNGQLPKLAKQPMLKPFDHYRISIRDEDNGHCYQTMWNTYSMEEMEIRYKAALGKVIVAEIAIFCSEPEVKKEVLLRDFVIEPSPVTPPQNSALSILDELSVAEDSILETSNPTPVENAASSGSNVPPQSTSGVNGTSVAPTVQNPPIPIPERSENIDEANDNANTPNGDESQLIFVPRFSSTQMHFDPDEDNLLELSGGGGGGGFMPEDETDHDREEELLRDSSQDSESGTDSEEVSHYFETSGPPEVEVENESANPPGPITRASRKRKATNDGNSDSLNGHGIPVKKPVPASAESPVSASRNCNLM